jgi:hypothetical protein
MNANRVPLSRNAAGFTKKVRLGLLGSGTSFTAPTRRASTNKPARAALSSGVAP